MTINEYAIEWLEKSEKNMTPTEKWDLTFEGMKALMDFLKDL